MRNATDEMWSYNDADVSKFFFFPFYFRPL